MANNDASTVLNPGSGGDAMDETVVTQSDGTTSTKRPRVDLGFQSSDVSGRLVDGKHGLPVSSSAMLEVLQEIRDEIRSLNFKLSTWLDD